jgi:hypothetical protein
MPFQNQSANANKPLWRRFIQHRRFGVWFPQYTRTWRQTLVVVLLGFALFNVIFPLQCRTLESLRPGDRVRTSEMQYMKLVARYGIWGKVGWQAGFGLIWLYGACQVMKQYLDEQDRKRC